MGALLDSAYWIDLPPYSPAALPFATEAQRFYNISRANQTLSPACLAAQAQGQQWRCLMGQYAAPFTPVPFIFHAYQYDQFQITHNLGQAFDYWPRLSGELQYAEVIEIV